MQRQLSAKKLAPQAVAVAIDEAVGTRIRALRKSKALLLKTIATKTGFSIGFLSQIERGLSSPTLRALMTLADAMQVNLADIIRGATAPLPTAPVITRAADRSSITLWKSGIRKLALAGGGLAAGAPFSMTLLEFAARASSGVELYTHQGEEAGYVLQGRLLLEFSDRRWILEPGDSFHFASDIPHRFENPLRRKVVAVMINIRP